MEVPGFSDQRHHRRFGAQKRFEVTILRWFDTELCRRAECCNLGASQFKFFNLFEEIRVALVGAWVSAFNIVDAKYSELAVRVLHDAFIGKQEAV